MLKPCWTVWAWMAAFCAATPLSAAQGQQGQVPAGDPQNRRPADPADIQVSPGYEVDLFAANLSYPVDITFSDDGKVYVVEAGGHTYGTKPQAAPPARILQLLPSGDRKVIYDKVLPLDVIRKADFGKTDGLPEGMIMPLTGLTWPLMFNKSGKPASVAERGGLERPIMVEWGPDGALYVVDFGVIEFSTKGMKAHPKTGVIWRIRHTGGSS